jgi:hypothetical protein
LPDFHAPAFDWRAVAIIAPVAVVTFIEHVGDVIVNGRVVGKNFLENPGLSRTLFADGIANMSSAALGGPAATTYAENTGVLPVYWLAPLAASVGAAPAVFDAAPRGDFAYYDGLVIEVVSQALGPARPVAVGGRYDSLPARLSGGSNGGGSALGGMIRPGRALVEVGQ